MAKEEEWYNSWYEPDGDGTLADDTLAASMLLGSLFIHIYIYTYIHTHIDDTLAASMLPGSQHMSLCIYSHYILTFSM